MQNWNGMEILVVGAARQGLAATRFLSQQGAKVTLTDGRDESHFSEALQSLETLQVQYVFGDHPLSLLEGKDMVCVSGGVPLDIPLLKEASAREIQLTNDAQIFLEHCKARTIGITGSAGKTTTTTLIGEAAKASVGTSGKVWVGGNIGNPLIEYVDQISKNDWIIMELSSFQLELMQTSTDIAIILNITPNHLDRHKTMAAYTNAKAHILDFQIPAQKAILNRDDQGSFSLRKKVKGQLVTFGMEKPVDGQTGSFIDNGRLKMIAGEEITEIMSVDSLKLPGKHNLMNALAASAAGIAAGFSHGSIAAGISNVEGIPHRLELVKISNGVRWYNDSIATAPERVIAALEAIPGPLVLLLGGRDKNLPWENLAAVIAKRKAKIIIFGEAGEMIESVLERDEYRGSIKSLTRCDGLKKAVDHASQIAETGEAVLLSPGCTSYDAFFDFEERGNIFRELVEEIA